LVERFAPGEAAAAAGRVRGCALAALLLTGCAGSGAERPAAPPAHDPGSDLGGTDVASESRCQRDEARVSCSQQTLTIVERQVFFQLPLGLAPEGGWPTVLWFQGSFFPASHTFSAVRSDPFGAYDQAATVKALLDGGWAVIAPEAAQGGTTFWDTNIPPWSAAWSGSPDDLLMQALFAAIERGAFGPLAIDRLYAAGLSSGGYMTSRMAVSYPGRFRALVIESASYATCGGAACVVPMPLSAAHPPTLFLHGQKDEIVPIATMQRYHDELVREGHATDEVIDADAGHQWIAAAPVAVPAWLARFR
jgi:pimeloyl-ACP methyl ester carboxylesterase